MPESHARFGTDLRLLGDLDHAADRDRGSDLLVRRAARSGLVDADTVSAVDNLKQALLLRFLTHMGELAGLGHPEYGSRLVELIGELNTETTRNRAKMFTLQALAGEPRVRQVLDVQVRQPPGDPNRVEISVSLLAIDSDSPLNLVFGFSLEGGAVL